MTKISLKAFMPVMLFFIIVNGFLFSGKSILEHWKMDQQAVIIGNVILFLITFFSFILSVRGFRSSNPHAFVRSVYSSIMIRLFLCMILAFVYISVYKTNLNKPALFTCMGLYLIYTFSEVSVQLRLVKGKKNE